MWVHPDVAEPLDPKTGTLAANAIRALAIDAVNRASSGHPGAPMGLADIATVLWAETLRYDPEDPDWPDRDRFVLSNGHACMLQYAALHLSGYDLSIDDLKAFRQLHSRTPGHPEYRLTPGVEVTTGPLGQGFANAVGMAIGRRLLGARFPEADGFQPFSHRIYGILGDGCVMEGISSEAASLAGHLGLGELIFFFDDNGISIDGDVGLAMSEDVEMRFSAQGWHTQRIDGHDPSQIRSALAAAQRDTERPSLILAKTRIGYGSPNKEGTGAVHGEALGEEEGRLAKERLGWNHPPFEIPREVYAAFGRQADAGRQAHRTWAEQLAAYLRDPNREQAWRAQFEGPVRLDIEKVLAAVPKKKEATRKLSHAALNAIAAQTPRLIGGSADLTGSNKSKMDEHGVIQKGQFTGRNLHFGVREHAMAAAVNGLARYGGFVPYGATFLTFSDYMRNSVRLSALMKVRAIEVYTHDSIGLGEDGPTHQPIEHLWSLRMIPFLSVWRPADGVETAMAWAYAVSEGEDQPHALVFSRQSSETFERPSSFTPRDVWKGAYIVRKPDGEQAVIVATGTEVALAVAAADLLAERGRPIRVISMPCVERYLAQDEPTKADLFPPELPRIALEAGQTLGWYTIIGPKGLAIGVETFGESAPAPDVYRHFGLTPDGIADRIEAYLGPLG